MDNKKYYLVSWNVDKYDDIVHTWLKQLMVDDTPDIIFLSETKRPFKVLKKYFDDFNEYISIINVHSPSCYHGVAMLINKAINFREISVKLDIPTRKDSNSCEAAVGRVITILFENKYIVVGTYVPNAGHGDHVKLNYRVNIWDMALQLLLNNYKKLYPTIWVGDINVALSEIDVSDPNGMCKYGGFTNEERTAFKSFLESDWVDIWRKHHPTVPQYSWRGNSDPRKYGMRLDNIIISDNLMDNILDSDMLIDYLHSDHVPICIHFK